jgi:Thiazole biosynthesis protein ThiG
MSDINHLGPPYPPNRLSQWRPWLIEPRFMGCVAVMPLAAPIGSGLGIRGLEPRTDLPLTFFVLSSMHNIRVSRLPVHYRTTHWSPTFGRREVMSETFCFIFDRQERH